MNAKHDLAEALCQLLETKTLEKITVKDIVARCGVNRQTFYYHFHDVYDLMRWPAHQVVYVVEVIVKRLAVHTAPGHNVLDGDFFQRFGFQQLAQGLCQVVLCVHRQQSSFT